MHRFKPSWKHSGSCQFDHFTIRFVFFCFGKFFRFTICLGMTFIRSFLCFLARLHGMPFSIGSDYVNGSTVELGSHDAGSRPIETAIEEELPVESSAPEQTDSQQTTASVSPVDEEQATGTPSAPREVEALIVSSRFITLRWKEPAKTNGHIIGYSVFYRQDGSERYFPIVSFFFSPSN